MNHPPKFDHMRWLFETKGTYSYSNVVWPKDGYGGGSDKDGHGGGSGANGYESPSDFGEKSKAFDSESWGFCCNYQSLQTTHCNSFGGPWIVSDMEKLSFES
ncbi:cellulose synthase-like protein D5 [Mercurialis annua]|uniref:cellulose synthase-like protein D5 n=1 Tax=Mercurialis annua TaxID=3986 RepID=UPI0024ADF3E3|nr:cellulose synthase-like protein D5 [Mercurialis annua]